VQGIADIITTPGLINRDFSDIRAIMIGMGHAMMGTATAKGDALAAARQAISYPLLEDGGVRGAKGILINITGSSRLSLHDVNEACSLIRAAAANDDVQINFGVVMNEAMGEDVKITVIATGFSREQLPEIARKAKEISVTETPAPQVWSEPNPPSPAPEPTAAEPEQEFTIEPEPAAQAQADELLRMNDLDTPAYLRRRRMVQ
jgi:cell division protein FtsZ